VFISHASEDKDRFVRPLALLLDIFGVRVWYDDLALQIGDSLSRSIDRGLSKSAFGIVVLSKPFMAKRWPEYELRGLVAKEMSTGKTILPIWHGVTHQDVLEFSPPLADKLALTSEGRTLDEIALDLIKVVRPDLLSKFAAHLRFQKDLAEGRIRMYKTADLKHGPIRHEQLAPDLVRRVRLVRAALLSVYPKTMPFWLDGFKREPNPSDEIGFWEKVAASFLEYRAITSLTKEQAVAAFGVVLGIATGLPEHDIAKRMENLPLENRELLLLGTRTAYPSYELSGLPMSMDETADIDDAAVEALQRASKVRYKGGATSADVTIPTVQR
jgi:hypothetical protein